MVSCPVEHTHVSLNSRLALYVVQTYKAIQKSQSEESALTETFPRVSSEETLVYPKFGHFANLGECDLERYARVYTLIRYVGHSAGKDISWGRYGGDDCAREAIIGSTNVPRWIAPETPASEPLAPDAPISGPISSKRERHALYLPITLKLFSNLPEPKAYREYIQDEEPELEVLLRFS